MSILWFLSKIFTNSPIFMVSNVSHNIFAKVSCFTKLRFASQNVKFGMSSLSQIFVLFMVSKLVIYFRQISFHSAKCRIWNVFLWFNCYKYLPILPKKLLREISLFSTCGLRFCRIWARILDSWRVELGDIGDIDELHRDSRICLAGLYRTGVHVCLLHYRVSS